MSESQLFQNNIMSYSNHNFSNNNMPHSMKKPAVYASAPVFKQWPSNSQHHVAAPAPSSSENFRSAAEARLDSSSKFRQLPCKTLVSTGSCPYGERCVFLHDTRLLCHKTHSISRMKNKDDQVADSFFWPVTVALEGAAPPRKTDHNFKPYAVPAPRRDQYQLHDQGLYSLWQHYVEFCRLTGKSQRGGGAPAKVAFPDVPTNQFTQRPRLSVFQLLSAANGRELAPEQIAHAEHLQPQHHMQQQAPRVASPPMQQQMPVYPHQTSPTSVTARLSFSEQQGHHGPSSHQVAAAAKFAAITHHGHHQFHPAYPQGTHHFEQLCGAEEHKYSRHEEQQWHHKEHRHHESCHSSFTTRGSDGSPQLWSSSSDPSAADSCCDDSVSVLSEDSAFAHYSVMY